MAERQGTRSQSSLLARVVEESRAQQEAQTVAQTTAQTQTSDTQSGQTRGKRQKVSLCKRAVKLHLTSREIAAITAIPRLSYKCHFSFTGW